MMVNGKLIRQIRIDTYLSREELAEGICSVEMLAQIEGGEANPSGEVVRKLADRLDVPVLALQEK